MNSTVLRVKRKFNDRPLSSLVVACKRPRMNLISDSCDPDVKTVAQFAGTILDRSEDPNGINLNYEILCNSHKRMSDEEDDHVTKKVKWLNVNSKVEKVKISKNENLLREKGKTEHLSDELAVGSEDASQNASEEKWMTFIDMEDSWSNFLKKPGGKWQDDKENYVYDLYYVDGDVWSDSDKIYVQLPEECMEIPYLDTDSSEEDSSDSNSESNWRNDYPDTDPFESDSDSDSDTSSSESIDSSFDDSVLCLYDTGEENFNFKLDTKMRVASLSENSSDSDSPDSSK